MLYSANMLDIVICPTQGWLTYKLADSKIPYKVLGIPYKMKYFVRSALEMMKYLRSRKSANIIHVHGRSSLFICILPLLFFLRLRFVATVHQFVKAGSPGKFFWKVRVETALLRRMNKICCVSEDLKRETLSRIGDKKPYSVEKISNWIEPYWYLNNSTTPKSTQFNAISKRPKLCAVGRLAHEKGFDILVEAIGVLLEQGYEVICDIYGQGPEMESLDEQINKLCLSKNITLKGAREDIRMLLPKYDILVIPSRSESFGITALEAFDASIPVVASDIDGLRELVVHKRSGLSFEADNAQSLASTIVTLLNSKDLRDELVSIGHSVLSNYIPNKALFNKYREFYSQALNNN